MKSLTKNQQSRSTINAMVSKYFNPLEMTSYKELKEGYFNMAYEISLNNGEKVVLKIAPTKDTRVMTYEKNIMYTEVETMQMVANNATIPAPKVLGYDNTCTICNSPYFFMEKLNGNSLNAIKDAFTKEQVEAIYVETGKINKEINSISCPCFGYPGQPEFQGSNWYLVFSKMMDAGIQDAILGNVDLQIPIEVMWRYLKRDKEIFEEVTEPKLVHWDCWDGNVFVEDSTITGIIDWERSLWADNLLEVGFRTYNNNTSFQIGYGNIKLTPSQKRRALWYDVYLLILVSLECEYRKYETMEAYQWATNTLLKQFKKLEQAV